jgi:hypothetical protein
MNKMRIRRKRNCKFRIGTCRERRFADEEEGKSREHGKEAGKWG